MFTRLGRFCVRRRWWVVAVWIVVLLLGGVIGTSVFGKLGGDGGSANLESVRAALVLNGHGQTGDELQAVVDHASLHDPALQAAAKQALADVATMPDVASVLSWFTNPDPHLLSTDGSRAAILVTLAPFHDNNSDRTNADLHRVRDRLHAFGQATGARVLVGGNQLLTEQINDTVQSDLARGELISLVVVAIALVFVFGGLLATSLPLIAAVVSIFGTLLVLLGYSAIGTLDNNVVTVVTTLALGLGIDYALLIVNRFREERSAGRDTPAAIERATATAGRSVAFSAITVAAALSGLLVFAVPTYNAMAIAGIGVALLSLLAAITLVPALLALYGHKVRLSKRPPSDEGFFATMTRASQRRPLAVVAVVTIVLLAAGTPFLHAKLASNGLKLLPASFETRQVADAQGDFSGGHTLALTLVATVPPTDPRVAPYTSHLLKRGDVASATIQDGYDATVTVLTVVPKDQSFDGATALVRELRADRPPYQSYVTGTAAHLIDFSHNIKTRLPFALLLMGLATLVLLFAMTGSLLVPLKSIVMNVLSLGASFGAIVWVFQDGHFARALGAEPMGGVEEWIPMLVLVFAFGLSMDYEVFLISRVKELYDEGLPNNEAVVLGVQRTGRIITSAALLIVIVFAGFGAGQMVGIKEMGIALTIAIIVDATVVRCLLVPATMSLLGNANWWAPAPLRRLHDRFGISEAGSVVPQRQPIEDASRV